MSVITSYLYDNKITVQKLDNDDTIKTRWRIVYNRAVDVYRGTDNLVKIEFKNQDQKPANISGHTITGYVIESIYPTQANANVVANVSVSVSNASIGTATVTFTEEFLANLDQNKYKLAFKSVTVSSEGPLYSDDNYGIYTELNIKPGF